MRISNLHNTPWRVGDRVEMGIKPTQWSEAHSGEFEIMSIEEASLEIQNVVTRTWCAVRPGEIEYILPVYAQCLGD